MINTSEIINRIRVLPPVPRLLLYSIGGLLVIGIVALSISNLITPGHPAQTTTTKAPTPARTSTTSPLIFGTNLQLANAHDQVLTAQPTRLLLQQLHVRIIRLPMHTSLSESSEVQAAQDVKNLGASLDVVLEGPLDATAMQDDTHMIHDMNTLFGKETVYYEFGNEQDLVGITASQYVSSWNHIIPQLKALAPHGQFIGPATYHYDQSYLQTFLKQARPRPDEVSWHEYTCTASDPQSTCLAHINTWSTHLKDARAMMTSTIGTTLPIMITAWNYAPDARTTDGKSSDSAFMRQWTQKAFQTLIANHVFASMQYTCTNTAAPLINSNNTLSTQGTIFLQQYDQTIKTSPPSTVTPKPVPTPNSTHTKPTTHAKPTAHTKPVTTVPPSTSPHSTTGSAPSHSTTGSTSSHSTTGSSTSSSTGSTTSTGSTSSSGSTQAPTPTKTSAPAKAPAPPPAPIVGPWPIVSEGATGRNVTSIQLLLKAHGYSLSIDGDFGPQTASAVKAFQSAHGLSADGQVGPLTWPKLIITTSQGSSGAAVQALQDQLNAHGANLTVDADFGPLTRQAVINFQNSRHLEVDGIAGPQTWQSLVSE